VRFSLEARITVLPKFRKRQECAAQYNQRGKGRGNAEEPLFNRAQLKPAFDSLANAFQNQKIELAWSFPG
jgi:hypothetical protein